MRRKFIKVVAAWEEVGAMSAWWACELPCGHIVNQDYRRTNRPPVRVMAPCWICAKDRKSQSK